MAYESKKIGVIKAKKLIKIEKTQEGYINYVCTVKHPGLPKETWQSGSRKLARFHAMHFHLNPS